MTRRVRALVAATTLLAIVGFGAAPSALAASATAATTASGTTGAIAVAPSTAATSAETSFYGLVNAARTNAGRRPYVSRRDLVAVARAQAVRMASAELLAHNPHLTSDVRAYRWVGENVGFGYDVHGLDKAFLASPHHRANILDADFTEVGIGVAVRDGRIWVAEVFRQPTSTTSYGTTASARRQSTPLLSIGARGPSVRRLQRLLNDRVDAKFGARTRNKVIAFQKSGGLRPTGKADASTWRRLQLVHR